MYDKDLEEHIWWETYLHDQNNNEGTGCWKVKFIGDKILSMKL